ncbi:restriction endonuclease subunit S [Flavobacterium sp.]
MKSNYKRLGDFIEPCDEKNTGNVIKKLQGISNRKYFQKAKTNTIGVDLEKYRIVRTGQFAFNRATTRNGDRISIAYRVGKDCIVSPSYRIFKSKDENVLNSEYLMMWFKRPDFDRFARFKSHGSAHEFFDYGEMCEVELPIPSIEKQREIVKEYNVIQNRIALNNQLIAKLEETAQSIYKQWFVDFEFPDANGKPYKSTGGEMEWCEEFEGEIPTGWTIENLSSYAKYSSKRIDINKLTASKYISTENMLRDKKGIVASDEIPNILSATEFVHQDILISNIRPYLKKIWFADFEGGCSNDVLCIETLNIKYSHFIFNTLEQDYFFDYVMAGSKGTKMPRGDKQWIMNFKIASPTNAILNMYSDLAEKNIKYRKVLKYEIQNLEDLKVLLQSRMTKVESEIETIKK